MNSRIFKKTIENELQKINEEIDLKIIKGVSYKEEARRHKFLLKQLNHIDKQQYSFFQKSFNLISTFIL